MRRWEAPGIGLAIVWVAAGCGFHKASVPLTEQTAETLVHSVLKERLWPAIQILPDTQSKSGWEAAAALNALAATLTQPTVTIIDQQVTADCTTLVLGGSAAGPAAARLASLVDAAQPSPASDLEEQTEAALDNLRAFSANAEIDLLQLLEDPATGPDATIYDDLPHYPIVKQDVVLLGDAMQALGSDVSPATPAIVQLARQTAEDEITFLLEFHAKYLSTEFDTLLFLATWVPLDPPRYENLDQNGLPCFDWVADLNDLELNEGNAAWAQWSMDENALDVKVALALSQLSDDLGTVQAAWRVHAAGVVEVDSPADTAASLCEHAGTISAAVSASVTGSPTAAPPIGAILQSRLSDTFQLAQKSPDPGISGASTSGSN